MTVCILLPHLIFFFFLTKCLGLLNGSFCVLYSRSFMILVPLKLQLQFANVPIKVQCLKSDMYSACTTIISMFFIGLGGKINLQAPMFYSCLIQQSTDEVGFSLVSFYRGREIEDWGNSVSCPKPCS